MDTPEGIDKEEEYVNEKKAARFIDLSVQKLRNDRCKGIGIPYVKLGRAVRYSVADIIEYMERRKVKPDS